MIDDIEDGKINCVVTKVVESNEGQYGWKELLRLICNQTKEKREESYSLN